MEGRLLRPCHLLSGLHDINQSVQNKSIHIRQIFKFLLLNTCSLEKFAIKQKARASLAETTSGREHLFLR